MTSWQNRAAKADAAGGYKEDSNEATRSCSKKVSLISVT